MTVPFLDPRAGYRELRGELDAAYRRVMDGGWYVLGPEVEAFEAEMARHCGVRHAVGVGNGLDALTLALQAAGIGPGDEVIVPAQTFVATWLAVARAGARPVPADVRPDTLGLDPAAAAAAVTPRTAAILPVHLHGHPADMEALIALARAHGLFCLEDAAQAHGATLGGRRCGGLGDAGAFSFYPSKNLGAFGDGGVITTDDADLARRARRLRNYGAEEKYRHEEIGVNSRLDPLQAAFLSVKLAHLDRWNDRRAAVALCYARELARADPGITLPAAQDGARPSWHLYAVHHPARDALLAHLHAKGIGAQIHYPTPPHLTGAFAHLGHRPGAFPAAERSAATTLSLPIGPHLEDAAVERVCAALAAFATTGGARPAAA